MDNLGELVILIIFIIISIVGSLSKDKKKRRQTSRDNRPQSSKNDTIFKENTEIVVKEKPTIYYGEDYKEQATSTWNPEESYDTRETYDSYNSEILLKLERMKEIQSAKVEEKPTKAVAQTHDEKFFELNEYKKSAKIKRFSAMLKNPADLKDFIVISEILGKPKALRR